MSCQPIITMLQCFKLRIFFNPSNVFGGTTEILSNSHYHIILQIDV